MPTIKECEQDPSRLDQKTGCCGFAATLMHSFVTKSGALKDFLNCVIHCRPYRDVARSIRITERLLKRDRAGIIDIDAREDWMLCHALMILFKERSKQNDDGDWARCETYSELWDWSHGDLTTDTKMPAPATKVKELISAKAKVNTEFLDKLSYKRGDLAVPGGVIPNLVGLMDIGVASTARVPTSRFREFKNKKASQVKRGFSALTREVRNVQTTGSTASVPWSGIILGVGNRPTDAAFEAYDNVTHWVYVPARPNAKPGSDEFKIWSWGQELNFWRDIVDARHYYPAMVIELAK